jgi:hypothetical protein
MIPAIIEQTVDIPADRRLNLSIPAPDSVPNGQVRIFIRFEPIDAQPQKTLQETMREENEQRFQNTLLEAEEKTAWRKAHPKEFMEQMRKLRGSLSASAFGGMDGVTYQRKIRDEWEDRLVKMGLSNNVN